MNHRSALNGFACIIFDMDGTLTDTNQLIFASFNHVAGKHLGKTLSPREIIALFGPPEEGGLARLLGESRVTQAMDELCMFYREQHDAMASLHTGISELLAMLKGHGVLIGLFTGKGRRTTEITLRAFGLEGYFDIVVSGSDVKQHKPHPEGILTIVESFGLRPSEVLMVGDALSDIAASRSAGVECAAVVWDSYDREKVLAAGADYVFHTVSEMSDWFKSDSRMNLPEAGDRRAQ